MREDKSKGEKKNSVTIDWSCGFMTDVFVQLCGSQIQTNAQSSGTVQRNDTFLACKWLLGCYSIWAYNIQLYKVKWPSGPDITRSYPGFYSTKSEGNRSTVLYFYSVMDGMLPAHVCTCTVVHWCVIPNNKFGVIVWKSSMLTIRRLHLWQSTQL